jgi:YD repeat-containing protein
MVQCLNNILVIILLFIGTTIFAQEINYQTHEMEYDDLNRLERVVFSNGTIYEYTYDNLGNRTQRLVSELELTFVPDDGFEQYLIDEGYDTVMDDYVFTHNINNIEMVFMENLGIEDLTGIEDFVALLQLTVGLNQIEIIDVTQNLNLEFLAVRGNDIEIINVSQNTQLQYLELDDNNITVVDISQNPLLEVLAIQNTAITELNFSNSPNLKRLFAFNSSLVELDFSETPLLERLSVANNNLETLNVENGANDILFFFSTVNNPDLLCIQVDDENSANAGTGIYANWNVDAQVNYSEDCDNLSLEINELTNISLYPNPTENTLFLSLQDYVGSKMTYAVYDINGRLLEKKSVLVNESTFNINLSQLSTGSYIIKLSIESGTWSSNFIKQ